MRTQHRFFLTLPLLAALLAGCISRNAPSGPDVTGTTQDESEVAATLAENPALVDDEVSQSSEETSLAMSAAAGAEAGLGLEAGIEPLRFWREIRDVQRRYEIIFSDRDPDGRPHTAVVKVHGIIRGSFNIRVADGVLESGEPKTRVISKPLVDHAVRRLLVRRVRVEGRERGVWRVVATSGVEITSRGATSAIVSLRVESGKLDTTITDPLAFFRLRRMLKIEPGAEVKLTATTQAEDDVVLLYTLGRRVRFDGKGSVHTITFVAPDAEGLRHMGVNALSHGTLYDDTAPYDSKAWIEPYVVHSLVVAADTPDE